MTTRALRRAPLLRIAVPALGVALALAGAAGLSRAATTRTRSAPPATVLALRPEAVQRVALDSGGRHVELAHTDGSWRAGAGASVVTVALMSDVERGLLPLQAYRTLRADTASADYGLVDPEITLRVTDTAGGDHEVALGRPTFTNGGVYAQRRGDPGRVYLVPRRMMDDLRSLVAGRRVDSPDVLGDKVKEAPKDEETSWWLKQALDGGAPSPGAHP